MRKILFLLGIAVLSVGAFAQEPTEGSLYAVNKKGVELGACPLTHTSVKTDISGFLARVRVTQEFQNSFAEPIEAVYTFPLSQNGAVDDMTMKIGDRTVRGKIMKKEEARQVYETAKSEGKTTSLLDQERPNIFTQAVANIMPGDKVVIEISYVETLKYDDGAYEFVFPMTVAPRYIPASQDAQDAQKISPPLAAERAGHDISIEVNLNAGVPIEAVRSDSHEIRAVNLSATTARVSLANELTIPNKDFVLRYDVTGKRMEDAVLVTRGARGGFFSLILSPPDRLSAEDVTPKEIVFVLDTSGSMGGFPIEKAKESIKAAIEGLFPDDTFNLITFAGDTHILFDKPVPATKANIDKAEQFLESRQGDGGTEMMDAIRAALEPSDSEENIRIVCFMTDGEVGNDLEIISEVKKHPNARVFSFGIGESVNRFLLDNIAKEGRGEAEYVLLEQEGSPAAKRFHERIRNPYLTDISIDWNGMPITSVYPKRIPDLFGAKPVVIFGRYTSATSGTIKLTGKIGGQPFEREIKLNLPATGDSNAVLSTLWARTKVDELMSQSWDVDEEEAKPKPLVQAQITKLGVDYGLMTQYTSFVAVDERVVTQIRNGKSVQVPVYAPAGTVFADKASDGPAAGSGIGTARGGGIGSGNGSGAGSGGGGGGSSSMPNSPANVTNLTVGKAQAISPSATPVGTVSETVTVAADQSVVQTSNSSVGSTINSRQISSLPLSSQSTINLLTLKPGLAGSPRGQDSFLIDGSEVSNYKSGTFELSGNQFYAGGLVGRALSLPKPIVLGGSRVKAVTGNVDVAITVDEKGNVGAATAISGSHSLQRAAEKAAAASKFEPLLVGSKLAAFEGVLHYRFTSRGTVLVSAGHMRVMPPPLNLRRIVSPAEKLHFWLYALAERVKNGDTNAGPNEAAFVRENRAAIRIELLDASPGVLQKLKALGFELRSQKDKTLTGRIPIDKLAALADVDAVKLVLPKL